MKLLALLKSQAIQNGDKTAHRLPDRIITYRRLWARIERAAARLQGEWQVQPGEVVAYYGDGHPDSLVLYCALLQIGAQLLALEGTHQLQAQRYLREMNIRLLVHDDNLSVVGDNASRVCTLSDMLAQWCHFDPLLVEENPALPALWLPDVSDALLPLRAYALQELGALPSEHGLAGQIGHIFSPATLTDIILPALADARLLRFAAIDAAMRSISPAVSSSVPG